MAHLQCNLIRRPRIPIPLFLLVLDHGPGCTSKCTLGLSSGLRLTLCGSPPDGYVRLFLNYTVHTALNTTRK